MDGENNGKPYDQMDDLGIPLISEISKWVGNLRLFSSDGGAFFVKARLTSQLPHPKMNEF